MCEKCDEIDERLERLKRWRDSVLDQDFLTRTKLLMDELAAQKVAFHPDEE